MHPSDYETLANELGVTLTPQEGSPGQFNLIARRDIFDRVVMSSVDIEWVADEADALRVLEAIRRFDCRPPRSMTTKATRSVSISS